MYSLKHIMINRQAEAAELRTYCSYWILHAKKYAVSCQLKEGGMIGPLYKSRIYA